MPVCQGQEKRAKRDILLVGEKRLGASVGQVQRIAFLEQVLTALHGQAESLVIEILRRQAHFLARTTMRQASALGAVNEVAGTSATPSRYVTVLALWRGSAWTPPQREAP